MVAVGCANSDTSHLAKEVARPTRHFRPEGEKQGKALGLVGRRWPAAMCSGEGSRRKTTGHRIGFGVAEGGGLPKGSCPRQRELTVGEEGRHVRVVVTDGVGAVGEELVGCVMLGVGSRGSGNGWRSPALGRCSQ
jgi:hypothetical protein